MQSGPVRRESFRQNPDGLGHRAPAFFRVGVIDGEVRRRLVVAQQVIKNVDSHMGVLVPGPAWGHGGCGSGHLSEDRRPRRARLPSRPDDNATVSTVSWISAIVAGVGFEPT